MILFQMIGYIYTPMVLLINLVGMSIKSILEANFLKPLFQIQPPQAKPKGMNFTQLLQGGEEMVSKLTMYLYLGLKYSFLLQFNTLVRHKS